MHSEIHYQHLLTGITLSCDISLYHTTFIRINAPYGGSCVRLDLQTADFTGSYCLAANCTADSLVNDIRGAAFSLYCSSTILTRSCFNFCYFVDSVESRAHSFAAHGETNDVSMVTVYQCPPQSLALSGYFSFSVFDGEATNVNATHCRSKQAGMGGRVSPEYLKPAALSNFIVSDSGNDVLLTGITILSGGVEYSPTYSNGLIVHNTVNYIFGAWYGVVNFVDCICVANTVTTAADYNIAGGVPVVAGCKADASYHTQFDNVEIEVTGVVTPNYTPFHRGQICIIGSALFTKVKLTRLRIFLFTPFSILF